MNRFHHQHEFPGRPGAGAAGLLPGHRPLTRPVVKKEIAEPVRAGTVCHLTGGIAHRDDLGDRHLQRRLARLVQAAERVVPVRAAGHLDMAAKHVADRVGGRELGHPVQARDERGHVADVEAARIDGVAGEQEPRCRVVHGDRRVMVPRGAGHVQRPAAQVERDDLLRPSSEAEELANGGHAMPHDHGARPARELAVARHMVAVRVRVGDDEFVIWPSLREQAVHGLPDGALGDRTGVEQQRPVRAAQQVHEGRLVVQVLALPQDERGAIDWQHLHRRIRRAARPRPVDPPHVPEGIVRTCCPHATRAISRPRGCRSWRRTWPLRAALSRIPCSA